MPLPVVLGALAGQAMGIASQGIADNRQIRQQGMLGMQQIAAQRQMGEINRKQEMRKWEDTNYKAQVEQLKKAGLNPGLLYGGGGGGGGASASSAPGSVTGGQAPAGGGEMQAMGMMAMNAMAMQAQIKNTEADTELKKVEAEKKAGVDTDEAKGRIGIMEVDQILKKIEANVQGATAEDRIDKISYETRSALVALSKATTDQEINRETQDAQIKTIKETAIYSVLKNALTKAQTTNTESATDVNRQKINESIQTLMMDWDELGLKTRKLRLEQIMTEYNTTISPEMKAGLGMIEQAVDGILRGGRR